MPLFFFDTNDGDHPCVDDEGQDLLDAEAARRLALEIARTVANTAPSCSVASPG